MDQREHERNSLVDEALERMFDEIPESRWMFWRRTNAKAILFWLRMALAFVLIAIWVLQ